MNRYNFMHCCDSDENRGVMIKNFGSNIREIRRRQKLTQEQVAELAKINPKYLGEIERGIKNPTVTVAQRLATALGVPVCEILSKDHCPMEEGLKM